MEVNDMTDLILLTKSKPNAMTRGGIGTSRYDKDGLQICMVLCHIEWVIVA